MNLCNAILYSFLNGVAATAGVLLVLGTVAMLVARMTGKRFLPPRKKRPQQAVTRTP